MEYQYLSVYKYNGSGPSRTREELELEYQRRLDGYSTTITTLYPNLDIDQLEQSFEYPLFFVQTNTINGLLNLVLRHSVKIRTIAADLPGIAKDSYVKNLLTQEIFYTNEIEGVKTSKKEISTMVGEMDTPKFSQKRLGSTIKLYNDTISGTTYQINNLADFRKIYDTLLAGEITDDNQPDGQLFRDKKETYIGNAFDRIHTPPKNERDIQLRLRPLIAFMNSHDILDIVKAIVTHFMFENIHPFYDGNGRTGRYLLSSYLANKLDTFTGLSISNAIHTNQAAYYKAFKDADQFENRADITLFITKLLQIIEQGQAETEQNLFELSDQLEQAEHRIKNQFSDENEREVLYIFAQSYLFSDSIETGIKDTPLINGMYNEDSKRFKKTHIKKIIEKLETDGYLKKISKKPLQHVLNPTVMTEP